MRLPQRWLSKKEAIELGLQPKQNEKNRNNKGKEKNGKENI